MKYLIITMLCLTILSCSTMNTDLSHEQIQNLEEAKPDKILSPRYPRHAAINRLEGFVKFIFDITPDGRVENLKKTESVPLGVFDDVATYSISKWLFKPAKIEGKAVWQKNMTYTLEFKMGE